MNKIINILNIFSSIRKELNLEAKLSCLLYCLIIFLSSVFELVSILLTVPFISFLINSEIDNPFIDYLNKIFPNLIDKNNPIYFLIIYSLIIALSAFLKIFNFYIKSLLTPYIGYQVADKAYKVVLNQNLNFYQNLESSDYINTFGMNLEALVYFVDTFFSVFSSLINVFFIFSAILIVEPKLTLYSLLIFFIIYLTIGYSFNNKLAINGDLIKDYQNKSTKILQASFGNIRDILLHKRQNIFINEFLQIEKPAKLLIYQNKFLGNAPKPILEGIAILTLVVLGVISFIKGLNFIPLIGALALGVQKILPAMQELFSCWVGLLSFASRVKTVSDLLNKEMKGLSKYEKKLEIKNLIEFSSVSFRYDNSKKYVLKDISLKILKGQKVGFIGSTGCGKSSLLDIFMGLQKPSKGKFTIDEEDINIAENVNLLSSWQDSIALVPQSIFIPNLSLLNNIAFGIKPDEIDIERVKQSARIAKLDDLIVYGGYEYKVGEYGKKISGGQRQRIAIARSVYLNSDVFVFDEATSALDKKTEKEILKNIISFKPNATIIIISHRLSILETLDKLFFIKNGAVFASGRPQEIIRIYRDINKLD